jgi:hypothetical protein
MSSQKLLIIVLVAIVVIFVITIGIGGCHAPDSGKDSDHPGAVGALKGLQGKHFLKLGDKATASCAPPGAVTLAVNGSCIITVQKRAFFRTATRIIFRRCVDPPSCQTASTFPFFQVIVVSKNGPKQNEQIIGKKCFATAIDHAGGTMTLIGNATIVLQKQGCPKK